MAVTFPENEVEVLRRYLPDELHEALQRVRAELTRLQSETGVMDPQSFEELHGPLDANQRQEQARAFEVREARGRFLHVLTVTQLGLPDEPPATAGQQPTKVRPKAIVKLDEITDQMLQHNLPDAVAGLTSFDAEAPAANLQLDQETIATVFTAEPLRHLTVRVTKIIQTPQGPKEIKVREEMTLPGYQASARLAPAEIDLLLVMVSFLSSTPERTFRLGVMRSEACVGLRRYDEALREYARLLPAATNGPVGPRPEVVRPAMPDRLRQVVTTTVTIPGHLKFPVVFDELHELVVVSPTVIVEERDTTRDRFVALRSGFAQLGQADALFRQLRNPDAGARVLIRAAYDAAVQVAGSNGVSPDNPLRQQIEQYAALQSAKLDAGLNILGYRDSYVPILRPAKLKELAVNRIQAADEAAQRFELFKSKADQMEDQLRDLDFQKRVKEKELAIADQQVARANEQVAIADTQIAEIDAQLGRLDLSPTNTDLLADLGGSLLQGLASGFLAGSTGREESRITGTNVPGVAGAISGIASTVFGYRARKDDLERQKKIAEIGARIARRDVTIAELGKQITETTIDFLGERARRLQNRELNPDLYYAAAEAFRAMAERHLDAAILWSYLFERSVVFLRLEPNPSKIGLDYLSEHGLLAAPGELKLDLMEVDELNDPITKFQFLTETYSLRSLYPLEFNRFLQTGRMDFALSLYELNKRRPGVYRQRIKRVHVELQSPPPSGFTGQIRHRGSFLLRDKDTTPEPGAGRLMPSSDELEAAFAALGAGATQGVSIGGVMPFLLDVDSIELSPDPSPPELGDPAPEALMPIEGYGPAGDWTLEVENVDLRFITDALLKITYVIPESDEPLSNRVRGLIAAYEQELLRGDALDLISPFSLRRRFRDAFDRLGSGQAQPLAMKREDFPAGIIDLKLKTIVVQALDPGEKGVAGVALELSRPGTAFRLERTTRADGFSEDLTAEIPTLPPGQRVDLEGTYTVRLVDPGQFAAVNDLLVFFIYEFREV